MKDLVMNADTPEQDSLAPAFGSAIGATLSEWSVTLIQEADTNKPDYGIDNTLTISMTESGSGQFLVLATDRFALNDNEIDDFCAMLKRIANLKL